MRVTKWNVKHDGILTEDALSRKLNRLGYSTTVYTYPAGTVFPSHSHAVDKIDGVISGQFLITMEDHEYLLQAGDCIEVPRGVRHAAAVVGNEPVISIDAIKR